MNRTDDDAGAPSAAATQADFALTRDRDAWATIRGYAYQIDQTIMAWLNLSGDDILELERGEDIDTITTALQGDQATASRLLEQVKHREQPLTLLSAPAKEALANFVQHRLDNPNSRLRFRFSTTAVAGRERRSPLPARQSGILLWERIRRGELDEPEEGSILLTIREMLRGSVRPATVPEEQWARFVAFVAEAEDSDFRSLVKAVEWSTSAPDSPSLHSSICQRLETDPSLPGAADSEVSYQRLFVVVLKRLSQQGIKRLTRADLREALSALPTGIPQELLTSLAALHAALASRVGHIETKMQTMEALLTDTAAAVGALARNAGITADIDPRPAPAPSITVPQRVAHVSTRTVLVDGLLVSTRSKVLVLHGGVMTGRTQLALLLAERFGTCVAWIRLLGAKVPQAADILARSIDAILQQASDPRQTAPDWAMHCDGLADGSDVLVVDDVPAFRDGDPLGSRLLPLLQACLRVNRTVVLISSVPLVTVERLLPPEHLQVLPVPPMTSAEVADVFASHSAPPNARAKAFVTLVAGVTRGHPLLVQAAAQWLKKRLWPADLTAFDAILRGTFAAPVNRDTLAALLESIGDQPTRELLYRLALTAGDFGREELETLADVPPPIERPFERLAILDGPWIQRSGIDRHVVSPLIQSLGVRDLSATVRRQCHLKLGRLLISRRRLDDLAAIRALSHLVAGEDFDTAAILLVHGLFAVYEKAPPRGTLITSVYIDVPLPTAMPRPHRAMIRALQVVIAEREKRVTNELLADLTAILNEEPALEPWAEFSPAVFVGVGLAGSDAVNASPFIGRALKHWTVLQERFLAGAAASDTARLPDPDSLGWLPLAGITEFSGVEAWLQMVSGLTNDIRSRLWTSDFGIEACVRLADRILLMEYQLPAGDRDWNRAINHLDILEAASCALGATPLISATRAARINALCELSSGPNEAVPLAEAALADSAADPDGAFLAAKALGYGAYDTGHHDEARTWFANADKVPGSLHQLERVRVKLWLARLVGESDPVAAVQLDQDAVALARTAPRSLLSAEIEARYGRGKRGDTVLPGALGELALARWFAGNQNGAYRQWLEALDELMASRDDEDETWRSMFVLMGHVSGYFCGMATEGEPPKTTADGTPYAAPTRGMLILPKSVFATHFRADLVSTIGIHAMLIADSIGDSPSAVKWASYAVEGLESLGLWVAALAPRRRLIDEAISRGNFSEAIEHATEAAAAYLSKPDVPRTELDPFQPSEAPRQVLETTGSDWNAVDGLAVTWAVLPAFLRVANALEVDSAHGRVLAQALHEACLTAAGADPASNVWPEMAQVCQASFTEHPNGGELRREGQRLREMPAEFRTVGVLAVFGASLDRTAHPVVRAKLQLSVAQYLVDVLRNTATLLETVGEAFFRTFWRRVFDEYRAYFAAPANFEKMLDEAAHAPSHSRIQLVLKAIAQGLEIQVPADVRTWLDAPTSFE